MDEGGFATAALEAIERDAYADFWDAAPPATRQAFGLAHRPVGDGVLLRASGLGGSMIFNRLLGYGVSQPAKGAAIDESIAEFDREAVAGWVIQVAPTRRISRRSRRRAAWCRIRAPG